MLESDEAGKLRTWRLDAFPEATTITPAEAHRRDYLRYEGEISNARGQVKRVAAGEYEILDESDERMRVRLSGEDIDLNLPLTPDHS